MLYQNGKIQIWTIIEWEHFMLSGKRYKVCKKARTGHEVSRFLECVDFSPNDQIFYDLGIKEKYEFCWVWNHGLFPEHPCSTSLAHTIEKLINYDPDKIVVGNIRQSDYTEYSQLFEADFTTINYI